MRPLRKRVVDSAKVFAQGFLRGNQRSVDDAVVLIDEYNTNLGANSLTPVNSCKAYDISSNDALIDSLSKEYMIRTTDRLNYGTPNLNLIPEEVEALFDYCGYDLNVAGKT